MQTEWERRDEFLALNPAGEVPVFIELTGDETGVALAESTPSAGIWIPLNVKFRCWRQKSIFCPRL